MDKTSIRGKWYVTKYLKHKSQIVDSVQLTRWLNEQSEVSKETTGSACGEFAVASANAQLSADW